MDNVSLDILGGTILKNYFDTSYSRFRGDVKQMWNHK
jgi:hypothetical protein